MAAAQVCPCRLPGLLQHAHAWRCDSRLLECLPKLSESHLDVPDLTLRVVLCPTPRLASPFRAEFIPSVPRCLYPAAPCGMNYSVGTLCLGVAVGGVVKAALHGCFLMFATAVSTARHHAACCCSSLQLTNPLHRLSGKWFHVTWNSLGEWSSPGCSQRQSWSYVLSSVRPITSSGCVKNCDCVTTRIADARYDLRKGFRTTHRVQA